MADFSTDLQATAKQLGFTLTGICPAVSPDGFSHLREWLDAGYAGSMHYLEQRYDAYAHPTHVLDGARSILMLAVDYQTEPPHQTAAGQGRVARYAWGTADYHDLIHDRLKQLKKWYLQQHPQAHVRGVVDTAPLMEREFAQLAGLGWVGKNTLLLNRQAGSWFFLAALLTDEELAYDAPHQTDHCGSCTACLDACPTAAFPQPYVMDASRCLSYLTIELRDPIPHELRSEIGDWVFGCDICQEVCPWNRHAPTSTEAALLPTTDANPMDLIALFELDDTTFRERFRKTPLWRPKRRGILRNAAMVLGNQRAPQAIPALSRGLADEEPLVRAAAAWALGEIGGTIAQQLLEDRQALEREELVSTEIARALALHH